jgi:hypothetical protein
MGNPNLLRQHARKCRSLLKTTDDPNIAEQLRVWAIELVDEAETVERRAPRPKRVRVVACRGSGRRARGR